MALYKFCTVLYCIESVLSLSSRIRKNVEWVVITWNYRKHTNYFICVLLKIWLKMCTVRSDLISNKGEWSSSSQHAALLRELTCHMGSHSVICHPAVVTFPPSPAEAGTRLSDHGGMQGWADLVGCYIPRWYTHKKTVTHLTEPDVVTCSCDERR